MGQYVGEDTYTPEIYTFEETDVVQGGESGIDNVPIRQLADRTDYLKNRLGVITHLEDSIEKTGNSTITATEEGYLIKFLATGVNTLTISNAATLTHGAIISISSYCNPNCVVNIAGSDGQLFYDSDGSRSRLYMHHKERLSLIALSNHFEILHSFGNFNTAGEEVKARKELINTLALKGQLLQRNQYPRLWEYVQSLTMGQEVTNEATWFYDNVTYRGLFTVGDGASTFRIPDERGLFERMVDLGRGLDISRGHNYPGGFENDELKSHKHGWAYGTEQDDDKSGGSFDEFTMRPDGQYNGKNGVPDPIKSFGGNETRPKNIGKLNLIKF